MGNLTESDYSLVYEGPRGRELKLMLCSTKGAKLPITLVKLTGKPAREAHEKLLASLSTCGGIKLLESTPKRKKYFVRADLAPTVGSYILLLRRSRNPSKWSNVFSKVLSGPQSMLGEHFANFMLMGVDLSTTLRQDRKSREVSGTILPEVADAVSASMKSFFSIAEKKLKR
ncbi:MAG: hypothetical protein QMC89_05260 [Candidatus Hodarchaeaceae archaeon]|nr:hypothetical protein [Candidatus Hodarchaeaceae archaeon]